MTCTAKVGGESASGSLAYSLYLLEKTLTTERSLAAEYYLGIPPQGQDQAQGHQTTPELRGDLSPEFARRLGIDTSRPLTAGEMAHLMNNERADGQAIEGRKKHTAHQAVADVFGLDPKTLPTVAEIENVLAGRRADGGKPKDEAGKDLSLGRVASSLRAFKTAIGVAADRDATPDEINRLATGKLNVGDYQKRITSTDPPTGYVDLTFSADKSVSVAWALAPTENERDIWHAIVQGAKDDALAYVQDVLGVARRGAQGQGPAEAAELAWISVPHYTARPAADVVRRDAAGNEFTDWAVVPGQKADPQFHYHNIVLSSMLTDSGRIAAADLSRLHTKVIGAVFHAAIATRAREHGIDMQLGPNGEARVAAVPDWVRKFYSRRSTQGEEAAREFAKERGKDWDALDGEERIALLRKGAAATRRDKDYPPGDGRSDFQVWQADAAQAGYRHRSTLQPDTVERVETEEQRINRAREAAMPLLAEAFKTRAVITGHELDEIAARGLIVASLGKSATDDIGAVVQTLRDRGVTIDGQQTRLEWGMERGPLGRPQAIITTSLAIAQERELAAHVQTLAADRSTALSPDDIDRAAARFLAKNPRIDRDGAQWKSQIAMAHAIGESGRFSLSIGVAGSGKTSAVASTLVNAWHEKGKTVIGMTVPWKASDAVRGAGVDQAMAIDAFLRRVETGKIGVDRNTVILADEVSMIGMRQQLALARLAEKTGAQLVEIGDPRQCQAVETPAIDLIAKAIGDQNIPKLLTSIRQQSDREREIAGHFREGRTVEAVQALHEDRRLHLVAGGSAPTIQRVTDLWRNLTDANAEKSDHTLLVMAPTNAQAREIGLAIRANRRAAGEIGARDTVLQARDPNSGERFNLPVAVGDKLRMFTRTYDAEALRTASRNALTANGDVVTVLDVQDKGLRIRNARGDEGLVTWAAMKPWKAPKTDPVHLTYGYAVTIDTSQSMTVEMAILAMPEGSRQVSGYKAYTGASRQTAEFHMVTSDAAERREIVSRQPIGGGIHVPSQDEVLGNLAANLGRFGTKRQANAIARQLMEETREDVAGARHGIVHSADPDQTVPDPSLRGQRHELEPAVDRWADVPLPIPDDRWADVPPPDAETPASVDKTGLISDPVVPPASQPRQSDTERRVEFAAELQRIGLRLPGEPVMDSKTGQTVTGRTNGASQPLNEAQREADQQARIARQQAQETRERATAEQARRIWAEAVPASPHHPYLARKEIGPEGLRQGAPGQTAAYQKDDGRTIRVPITGKLVVPMRDADGHVHNLQFIDRTGGKMFLQGRKKGLMASIGDRTAPDQPLIIAEGFATAATLRSTTALTTIIAFDAGSLASVAEAIRQKQPSRPIIIAGDNDHHAPRRTPPLPNVGLEKAKAAAERVGGIVVAPPFDPADKGTDWNDYAAKFSRETRGEESRAAIERQLGGLKLPAAPSVTVPGPAVKPMLDLSRYQQRQMTRNLDHVREEARQQAQQKAAETVRPLQRRQGRRLSM